MSFSKKEFNQLTDVINELNNKLDIKFFEVECPNYIEIIAANSEYEAFGLVALSENPGTDFTSDILVRCEHPRDHKIMISCIGFPTYKTLKEMYKELDKKQLPVSVCKLDC